MPLSECLTSLPMFTGIDSFVYVTQQIRIPDMASGRFSTILPLSFLKEMIGAREEKRAAAVSAATPAVFGGGLGEIPLEHLQAGDGLRVAKGPHVTGIKATAAKSRKSISRNVEALLNVPMEVIAELGSAAMEVDEILSITPGRVIELDRQAASPIGLYVNGKMIALGRIVVVGDNFGVEVTRILEPDERLKVE